MNQDAVASLYPAQIMQPEPRGAVTGGDRGGLIDTQALGQSGGQSRITGHIGAPTSVRAEASHCVADLMLGNAGSDRGDHACKIQTELWLLPVKGGVAAESGPYVRAVDA